ncbi:thymocyte nuclear protein 1-like [Montipora foliosa]|uniref:thymocyte nuclear protein 1-like n=1 Tax=Montipora foliosa TaxID=591990 RepID=UPI0035F125E2
MAPKKRKVESDPAEKRNKKSKQESQSTNTKNTKTPKQQAQYTRWLMKSEPESRFEKGVDVKFGIEDLKSEPNQTACWDGVRNYQARNFMRDQMKIGQLAFFYHSNCKDPGVAGIVEIVKESYVDDTQFDPKDPHYDPAAKKDNPKWFMVDVKFVRMMKRYISLKELKTLHMEHKASGGPLKSLALFTSARLSVQPVTEDEFEFICSLEDKEDDEA